MYDGYLALGGNEILNAPRAWALSRSANCPASWFVQPDCDTLADALLQQPYDIAGLDTAPWYDPAAPDLSERFFGLYGVDIEQVDDVEREVQLTEGLNDGAVVGRTRLPAKRIRARGFALAQGEDAMSHGMAWLRGALAPGACGQHGDRCGVTDLEMFTDCPPERPDHVVGTEVNRNAVLNPSFRDIDESGGHPLQRNLFTNPRFVEGAGANWAYVESTAAVRDGGVEVTVNSPLSANFLTPSAWPWGEARSATVSVSYTATNLGTAPIVLRIAVWGGEAYSYGEFTEIAPGQTKDVVLAGGVTSETSTYAQPRLHAIASPGDKVFITDPIMVEGDTVPQFFDGDSVDPNNHFTYAWEGAPDASPSIKYAPRPANQLNPETWITPDGAGAADITSAGEGAVITNTATVQPGTLTVGVRARVVGTTSLEGYILLGITAIPITLTDEWQDFWATRTVQHGVTYAGVFAEGPEGLVIQVDWQIVTPSEYSGQYFDGSTTDNAQFRYGWSGDPDASESIIESLDYVPYDDDEYAEIVREGKRYLHEVTVESGPLEVEKFKAKNGLTGRLIEMTFVAGKAHLYGPTVPRELPASATTVVEDIMYNLIETPRPGRLPSTFSSANYRAVNFMNNPSIETNVTGLTWTSEAITGDNPSSQSLVTLERTDELAVVGDYSARLRLLGKTSYNSGGRRNSKILMRQNSNGLWVGTQIKASVWAAGIIAAATSSTYSRINSITARFFRVPTVGSLSLWHEETVTGDDINGYLFEAPDWVVAAGTSTVRIDIVADVEWTSSATAANNSDIRIFADAFFVATV